MGRSETCGVKEKPVTLVKTVVPRKSAVQALSLFELNMPNTTTKPEPIPTKLEATNANVNAIVSKFMVRVAPTLSESSPP